MKISVNWIKEFTSIKLPVDELVSKIGSQIGEVEEVVDLGKQYEGVLVAKVVSCQPHPDADRLHVCLVDDGGIAKKVKRDSKGLVQVVCGAPNVRKGITVAWLPPGTIVPSSYNGEQFKLDVRPLRGVDSNGMIASPKELNIGDDHDGILVIDKPAKPGTSFAELYELNDYIIDIENKMFTHRPDCFGILGVAREIAGIQGIQFKSPEWYLNSLPLKASKSQKQLPLKITNKIDNLVPRFTAVTLSEVKVKKSPIIMQTYLSRMGIKPINNIVDITNFVMILTAQPLHAYDYDKVAAQDNSKTATLVARLPEKGEKVELLNAKTIEPHPQAIMIATKKQLIGVGGVMGGRSTEVDYETKNVILECANFDMYSIRKTSMIHGLFTEAVTRFNKGQSDLQNDVVLTYAVGMMQKLASADLAGNIVDTAPDKSLGFWKGIHVGQDFINLRLGLSLSTAKIAKLLTNVEMGVTANTRNMVVSPPFWRTDLEIPEDIVEEVGRLYGYDQLPLEHPVRALVPPDVNEILQIKSQVRHVLAATGANEVLTYSFVHGDLMKKVGQDNKQAFKLSNALSPDLQYYRLSLTPSLLDKVHMNVKSGYEQFGLFEMNKVHNKTAIDKEKLPEEFHNLGYVYVSKLNKNGAAYYYARRVLDYLLHTFNAQNIRYVPLTNVTVSGTNALSQQSKPFDSKRSAALVDSEQNIWGFVGEYRSSIKHSMKLPGHTAGFEINSTFLGQNINMSRYEPLSRFPSTHQDISFKVPSVIRFSEMEKVISTVLSSANNTHGYRTNYEVVDIYQKDSSSKHFTFRITVSHNARTLVTEEVNSLLDEVAAHAKKALKATRL